MSQINLTVQPGPWIPPYEGPFDVPVLIDDVKRFDDFRMTRCTFFMIEPTEALDDWVAALRAEQVPFLLLGLAPVIHRPDLEHARFGSPEDIDGLFERVERFEGLVVETSHIWLPNFLFQDMSWASPMYEQSAREGGDGPPSPRGQAYRISFGLLQQTLQFQREVLSRERFEETCRALMEGEQPLVTFSPEETEVFREWSARQLSEAKANYQRQKEDPERAVLDWRDEQGIRHKG